MHFAGPWTSGRWSGRVHYGVDVSDGISMKALAVPLSRERKLDESKILGREALYFLDNLTLKRYVVREYQNYAFGTGIICRWVIIRRLGGELPVIPTHKLFGSILVI